VAIFHRATVTPTKAELLASWAPTTPWGPDAGAPIELIGSYRFDDPEGRVGMETFLFTAGGRLLQAGLTYRDEPCAEAESGFVATMHHSVLGNRWVYDGVHDPRYVLMLAGVALTGQGEALGMVVTDGRWYVAPAAVRIRGGGWTGDRVPLDGFELLSDDGQGPARLRNDGFDLRLHRHPDVGPAPPIGLTATWDGAPAPVVVADIRPL
jgi:hypothetical protein